MAEYETSKPVEDDLRSEDAEFNVAVEPKSSKAWINLLEEVGEGVRGLERPLRQDRQAVRQPRAAIGVRRDREFSMFWANLEIIKPSIYAKPPTPVVSAKFKDRRPVYQQAAELMERCCVVAFDLTNIDDIMLQIRDDLSIAGRGVAWCRYESGKGKKNGGGYNSQYDHENVCVDHKQPGLPALAVAQLARGDVGGGGELHDARRHASGSRRTPATSTRRPSTRSTRTARRSAAPTTASAPSSGKSGTRPSRRVLWVAEGCEDILDKADPDLDLCNFFPCPKPAYSCTQPDASSRCPTSCSTRTSSTR